MLKKIYHTLFKEEPDIREQKEELVKISKAKDMFFANISHEIRTPINSIIGLNELILRSDISDETRTYAENVQNASKMLLSLVNDILDLSKLEEKRMELAEESYSTKKMLQEIVDIMQVQMNEKQLNFEVEIDKHLPSVLCGDERRIKQVLLNILSNAVKYTQKGFVNLTCQAESVGQDYVLMKFTVADTGCGIKKEEMDYLFDAYKRADSTKNVKADGTGLGLAITKQLVTLMGGKITVDSIYTQGSVFTVTIKQKIVDSEAIGDMELFAEKKKGRAKYDRCFEAPEARVLVVDDDELNQIVTTKLLWDTRMTIDTAGSGEECLRKTKQKAYTLILMDYMMPDMDGTAVLKEIRKQENGLCRETPVILLSAASSGKISEETVGIGFDAYLEKPIDAAQLEEEVLRFIPDELIEYRRDKNMSNQNRNMVTQLMSRRRKPIYITSDCFCDIPKELMEKYDIRIFYLYIKTKYGRFCDTKELDVNNLYNYLSTSSSLAFADEATLEEYENFFAKALTEAEEIIHITVAKGINGNYNKAMEAAKGFGHVHVIDSGHISGGQGLMVLRAAQLAQDGKSVSEICEELESIRDKIDTQMLLPGSMLFFKNGYTGSITAKICERFHLRPVIRIKRSRLNVYGTRWGDIDSARRRFIHFHLDNSQKYEKQIIFITHAGCSVKEQDSVLEEVRRCAEFNQIIISPTCVSNACTTGMGTIAYAVFRS